MTPEALIIALGMTGGLLFAIVAAVVLASGGSMRRIARAVKYEFKLLRDDTFGEKVDELAAAQTQPKSPDSKPSAAPLRLVALLQREGRLVDFLLEDIQGIGDAQVGAAVRDIHRKCQSALKEHLSLEPVITQAEGSIIDIPKGFDPSAIRLTGNVTGQPPYKGTLQHHGWRVKEIKLAPPADGQDEHVLTPAEVELP